MRPEPSAYPTTIATALRSAAIILLAAAIAATAGATEIYKWTDTDGNVQYGDRPTGADSATRLHIASRPTDPARIQAQATARDDLAAQKREAAAAEPKGPTPEEIRAEAREKAEKCNTYRQRLERFVQSRLLYREDENGERVYLDEAETLAAREKVQKQVEETCTP
jgi:hypothetical protein